MACSLFLFKFILNKSKPNAWGKSTHKLFCSWMPATFISPPDPENTWHCWQHLHFSKQCVFGSCEYKLSIYEVIAPQPSFQTPLPVEKWREAWLRMTVSLSTNCTESLCSAVVRHGFCMLANNSQNFISNSDVFYKKQIHLANWFLR